MCGRAVGRCASRRPSAVGGSVALPLVERSRSSGFGPRVYRDEAIEGEDLQPGPDAAGEDSEDLARLLGRKARAVARSKPVAQVLRHPGLF